ncbi:protein YgfX [Dyella sp. 20L07]|uniref:protein YgfX n=1 Tax=Dyella sp. 20L07 TaxID=3384240 RepID=UPI003D2E3FB2
MTSAPAIGFEYRPSRWMARVLLLFSLLALFALCLSALSLWLKFVLSMLLAVMFWRARRRFANTPVIAAGWGREGEWSLHLKDGSDTSASLNASRVMGDKAIWLQLCAPGRGRWALLLAPDNSDADIRRRLRMRLALSHVRAIDDTRGTLSVERGPRG